MCKEENRINFIDTSKYAEIKISASKNIIKTIKNKTSKSISSFLFFLFFFSMFVLMSSNVSAIQGFDTYPAAGHKLVAGDVIEAYIEGVNTPIGSYVIPEIAEGRFTIGFKLDDASTTEKEGVVSGDIILFKINNVECPQKLIFEPRNFIGTIELTKLDYSGEQITATQTTEPYYNVDEVVAENYVRKKAASESYIIKETDYSPVTVKDGEIVAVDQLTEPDTNPPSKETNFASNTNELPVSEQNSDKNNAGSNILVTSGEKQGEQNINAVANKFIKSDGKKITTIATISLIAIAVALIGALLIYRKPKFPKTPKKIMLLLLIILSFSLSAYLASAACVDPTGGLNITQPGSYYLCPGVYPVDTNNDTGTAALWVQASNVIVDCNGAKFIENSSYPYPDSYPYWPSVLVMDAGWVEKLNVTIKNCYFENFYYSAYGYGNGFKFIGNIVNKSAMDGIETPIISNDHVIENNMFIDVGEIAIFLDTTNRTIVRNNTVIRSAQTSLHCFQCYNNIHEYNTIIDSNWLHSERNPLWSDSIQTMSRAGSGGTMHYGTVARWNAVRYNTLINNKQSAIEYTNPNILNTIEYNTWYSNSTYQYEQWFICPKGGWKNQSCFKGNGTKTQFWLYYPKVLNDTLEVWVSGVLKTQGADYILDESDQWEPKLNFTTAPANGSNITVHFNFSTFVQYDGIENKNTTYPAGATKSYWGPFDPLNATTKAIYIDQINHTWLYDADEYNKSGYPNADCPPFVMTGGGGFYTTTPHNSGQCSWPTKLQTVPFCPILSAPWPEGRLVSCGQMNTQPRLNISTDYFLTGGTNISENLWNYASDWEQAPINLTYTLLSQTNPGVVNCAVNSNRFLNCTNLAHGYSNITLMVNDSEFNDTVLMKVVVNQPPQLSSAI
ncbi:MAG: right-handed parallel beta-helix repeat-containing protein, partial [Nanoarchaeota archaeon]|nr:right-handed parallel beta-helix repeat-containing protein [Nanoarchaeota archaeon]